MSITADVVHYLETHSGQNIHINEIVEATGLEVAQIQGAISNLRGRDPEFNKKVVVLSPGARYRYDENPTVDLGLHNFKEIAVTVKGILLVEDSGDLYIARKLDV